jgi:hypothetical protein
MAKKREKGLKKKWLWPAKPAPAWHTGVSGGQVPALGNRQGDVAINHRTVRWVVSARAQALRRWTRRSREKEKASRLKFIKLSGELTAPAANGRLRDQRATRSWANGRMVTPDCPVCTGHCPVRQLAHRTNGCDRKWRRSSTEHVLFMSGGAPDCPVRHPTEDKNCLPSWSPTAPSCLGAIKGTPRRMELYTKHSLNFLRLLDSASMHLDCCVSDLSSVWVVNSLHHVLSSSLGLCACVCCGLSLACVAFPPLLPCFLCD